ncbi:MAG: hypothetical protein ACRDVZ_16005 [Jiangellaceae bacterium]
MRAGRDMGFDEQLRHDMRSAVGTIDPPPATELVDGGVQRGRRMKRMRMARVVGGVATVAMLGGVGVVAVDQLRGGFQEAPADVAVASGDVQAVPPEEHVPVTAQVAVQTLLDLLPEGTTSQRSGFVVTDEVNPDHIDVVGKLVYDDGHGAGLVYINLSPTGGIFNGSSCEPIGGDPHSTCTTLEDGSVLAISEAPEYTDGRRPDLILRSATLTRADGFQVSMTIYNSETQKSSPVTRPEPALTPEQLTEIVTSPLWQAEVPASVAEAAEDLFKPPMQ